jgi:AcrR family transcriptional regulator
MVPRRKPTAGETRQALLAAGLAEFAEKGLDAPSLDAICARAGFTRGAFYVHFRGREDFLVAVMEHVIRAFLDAIIATGDEAHDLEHTIDRFADAVAAAQGARPPARGALPPFAMGLAFHRFLEGCARSKDLRERFVALVEQGAHRVAVAMGEGQRAGTVRHDVDPEPAGRLLALLALGIVVALDTGVGVDVAGMRAAVQRLLAG